MKKIISLIICFSSISINIFCVSNEDVLNEIKKCYIIDGECLINFEGKIYNKIPFKCDLHESLAYKLKDPNRTATIYRAYEEYILPALNDNNREAFQRALLQVCQLIGIEKSSSETALFRALEQEKFPIDDYNKLEKFLKDVEIVSNKNLLEVQSNAPKRVVIISTSTSGGNLSVAEAVKALLDQYPEEFEVILIDYETFASKYDPMAIASGKFTTDNIYRLLQQQANCVDEVIYKKDQLCQEVAKYIPNRTAEEMKKAIADLQPDLIISTRNYYSDDFNLLSLQIPFRMLNCDYEICFFHQDLVGKVDPKLVKFWLPSDSPRFFKKMFKRLGQENLYQKSDDWNTLLNKIEQVTLSTFSEIASQFEIIGFPVRLEFNRTDDQKNIQLMKSKWDLSANKTGILIEMGSNGLGVIESIFDLLKDSPKPTLPIKCYFVCGKNEQLRNKFQQIIKDNNLENTALKRCQALGYVSATEKNELMNICSLMISKPGGSTVAEITEMKLPMFVMHIHKFGEEGNLEKLLDDQMAFAYDPNFPLTDQIESALKLSQSKFLNPEKPDWQKLILEKIRKIY